MKILLDLRHSAYQNISAYFEEAKKWRRKADGAQKAMGRVVEKKVKIQKKEIAWKIGWMDRYHHAKTTGGFDVVSGKDAKQNDFLVSRHLKEGDLFFHAEIVGASATVLKALPGKKPTHVDLEQAAQMAASFSRAWKQGYPVVDVYAVKPDQVSKNSQGEYVGKGAFIISGERMWFKNTELKLYLKPENGKVRVIPAGQTAQPENALLIQPGDTPKAHAAKTLAKRFNVREEELLSVLPGDVALE